MFPRNQTTRNNGNRRALRVSLLKPCFKLIACQLLGFHLAVPFFRPSNAHAIVVALLPCSLLQDVSNRTTEDGDKPNATKRNGSQPPQRSVTLESRDEIEVSTNSAANSSNMHFPPPPGAMPLAPQAPAVGGMANNFMPGNNNGMGYQYSGPADDIDERDADDPLCATSYVQDMYEHFRSKEVSTSVRPVYMEDQQYINERMRSILVDWLVEVHLKFKLVPETLYLTVNIIDRYLCKTEVSRPKLQLVGVTALLIASKYEEIYPPELRDLVYICDRAYSKLEVSRIPTCNASLLWGILHSC